MTDIPGFTHLLDAPADILGKELVAMHWSGATERTTYQTKEDAVGAFQRGWTRYQIAPQPGEPT